MIIRLILCFLLFAGNSFGADWYFDKDSIGGTCNNTTGTGAIDQPFCSPYVKMYDQVWNAPAAGDTIYLRAGNYTGIVFAFKTSGGITSLSNGTEANPIIIRPYPGETVTFAGTTTLIYPNTTTPIDGVHFIGPFTATGYDHILEGASAAGLNKGWRFENWTIVNGASGFYARHFANTVFDDITCTEMHGVADHSICVGIRGDIGYIPYDITISNIEVDVIHDGLGGPDGDADGVWTNEYVDNVHFENITVNRAEEDGVDTKAQNVTMRNIKTTHCGATGIKLWGGNQARESTYNLAQITTFGNSETGIKCSGNGDTVTATIDHITAYANGEDNIKNVQGLAGSNACELTVRNALVGNGTLNELFLAVPSTDEKTMIAHLDHVNITHPDNGEYAITHLCPPLSGKYTLAQYLDGTLENDLNPGTDCTSYYGDFNGSVVSPTGTDPLMVSAPEPFVWRSISTGGVASDTVTISSSADYPWPDPVVGEYVELNDDGVRREIVAVGDTDTRTIQFTPSVDSALCGLETTCSGIRVVGWGSDNTIPSDTLTLTASSSAIDGGLFVEGVHCALSDNNGGSALTDCYHWFGSAPDLGAYEYNTGQVVTNLVQFGSGNSSMAIGGNSSLSIQ